MQQNVPRLADVLRNSASERREQIRISASPITRSPIDLNWKLLGVDPGISTGWAIWDQHTQQWSGAGVLLLRKIAKGRYTIPGSDTASWIQREMSDPLWMKGVTHIAIENYIQRPFKKEVKFKSGFSKEIEFEQNLWINQETAKVIGLFHALSLALNIPCFETEPSDKPFGYTLAGLTYEKGKKGTHIQDASAHARFLEHLLLKKEEGKVGSNS